VSLFVLYFTSAIIGYVALMEVSFSPNSSPANRYDSLFFLVWRESDKSLTLLAKDYEPTQVYASGLISRGGAMSFVCHDERQNLKVRIRKLGQVAVAFLSPRPL